MSDVTVAACVADLFTFGLNEALDLIAGQWGATGLTVWAGEPPMRRWYLADGELRPVCSDGGATFEPCEEYYRATRIRPPMSREAKRKARLEDVLAACRDRSLPVRVIVSAARLGRLCAEFPSAAKRDLFDRSSLATACINNPDVAALVAAMVEDLSTREGVTAVEIMDFGPVEHDARDVAPAAFGRLDLETSRALQICFCESCRQDAARIGVDADGARREARRVVTSAFGSRTVDAETASSSSVRSGDAERNRWSEYLRLTDAAVVRLGVLLKRASRLPLMLQERSGAICPEVPEDVFTSLVRWPLFEVPMNGERSPHRTLSPPRDSSLSPTLPVHACLDTLEFVGTSAGGAEFVRRCREYEQAGFAGLTLHTFGQTPPALRDAVRQAIRIVRREGT